MEPSTVMLKRNEPLSLDTPWGIGEYNYSKIISLLSDKKITKIIEFGSGTSTVRLSQDFPLCKIISFEDQIKFYNETKNMLKEHKIRNVNLTYCPLKQIRIGLRFYLTYNFNIDQLVKVIDFVLIDGPVESVTLRGREAPLYIVFPLIKIGGIIALHDYHRDSAKKVVKNWISFFNNNLKILREDNKIILLQKCGCQAPHSYPDLYSMIDNYQVNLRLCLRNIGKLVKSKITRRDLWPR